MIHPPLSWVLEESTLFTPDEQKFPLAPILGLEWATGGGPEALAPPDSWLCLLLSVGALTESIHFCGLQFPFMQKVCKKSPTSRSCCER